MKNRAPAFTLIELLVVVAIIAILSGIAVQSFFDAQTRSKVAAAQTDMRTVAVAIEAYAIAWNNHPPNDGRFYSTPAELTTPQSYIQSRPLDPFSVNRDVAAAEGVTLPPGHELEEEMFSYWHIVSFEEGAVDPVRNASPLVVDVYPGGNRNASAKYGHWAQLSVGPDGRLSDPDVDDLAFSGLLAAPSIDPWGYSFDIPYDPTNGTASPGNIFRTEIRTNGTVPDPALN